MALPVPERVQALRIVEGSAKRFTDLLRTSDQSKIAIGKWTTGELATHVSLIAMMYPRLIDGASSPVPNHLDMASYWDEALEEDQLRDPAGAADRIDAAMAEFVAKATDANWESKVVWHGGKALPVYALASILNNEFIVHGQDIATAEGKPWTISRDEALLTFEGHLPLLPYFANAEAIGDLNATYQVKMRGGLPVYFKVADGGVTVLGEPNGSVDCKISADPLAYLLVGYGRQGQWGPILTGKIVSYGKKPWLGLRFGSLFHSA